MREKFRLIYTHIRRDIYGIDEKFLRNEKKKLVNLAPQKFASFKSDPVLELQAGQNVE